MSDQQNEPPQTEQASDPVAIAVIERLLRIHNVLILLLVAGGMAVVLYVQTTHAYSGSRPAWTGWLTAARIALPILALVATFAWSNAMLSRLCRESHGVRPPMERVARSFFRAKFGSMIVMAVVVAFADYCLLFGHTAVDIALVLIPLAIFAMGMRPAHGNVEFFGAMAADAVGETRDRTDPPST